MSNYFLQCKNLHFSSLLLAGILSWIPVSSYAVEAQTVNTQTVENSAAQTGNSLPVSHPIAPPSPAAANSAQPSPAKPLPVIIPPSPQIDAKAYVLIDADSGAVLTSSNMNERLPPASLTKLMTLYVASEAIRQNQIHATDMVKISKRAWQMGGSKMFVQVDSDVPLADLIKGIIIASGNDACVAVAEHTAGSEDSFAQLMDKTAARLGMKNTHYVDSTGLPNPDHYSTAYDMALLTQALIHDFPEDYKWYKEKWIDYNNIRQPNRNRLLWRDPSVDGLKTGHTEEAGFCLIASGKRGDMRLISVVMGAPSDESRTEDSEALLNWGFHFYQSHRLFEAAKPLTQARVWLGKNNNSSLGLASDLYVTIPNNRYPDLKASMNVKTALEAPIQKGQSYGTVQVKLDDKIIAEAPLVALEDNPKGNIIKRFFDEIKMLFIRHK